MKYKNLENGSIYDVTNEALVHQYEADARFEKVVEKKPEKEEKAEKKSAKK